MKAKIEICQSETDNDYDEKQIKTISPINDYANDDGHEGTRANDQIIL